MEPTLAVLKLSTNELDVVSNVPQVGCRMYNCIEENILTFIENKQTKYSVVLVLLGVLCQQCLCRYSSLVSTELVSSLVQVVSSLILDDSNWINFEEIEVI